MSGIVALLNTYFDSLGFQLHDWRLRTRENCIIAKVIENLSYYAVAEDRSIEQLRLKNSVINLNEIINICYSKESKALIEKEKQLLADRKINHPKHYNTGSMETIVFLTELGLTEDFCLGNAIKYLSRYRYKGKQVEDLSKALWYIEYLIK